MTEIYGCSDDLIEFKGDVYGEVDFYSDGDGLIILSDGTMIIAHYGKPGNLGIWSFTVFKKGDLFISILYCEDEKADRYSDTVYFKDGIEWVYFAREFEKVK